MHKNKFTGKTFYKLSCILKYDSVSMVFNPIRDALNFQTLIKRCGISRFYVYFAFGKNNIKL